MENNYYQRIEINGDVNNLPKEKGNYYFFHGINESKLQLLCYCQKTEDSEVLPAFYIDKFDFYLQPISTPEVIVGVTEKEIEKEARNTNSWAMVAYKDGFVKGIDWYRSRLKTVNLKDELVKFIAECQEKKSLPFCR